MNSIASQNSVAGSQYKIPVTTGVLIVAVFLLVTGVVEAHAGGKMQIASQDTGPFKMTVWTSPDPARVGKIHVATAVASAEDALPILDAGVFIQLQPQNNPGAALSGPATTDNSVNQFLYERIFDVPDEGFYQVMVTVTGRDGQQGQVAFNLEVDQAPPLIFGLLALAAMAAVTAVAVWFYLRSTAPSAELEAADEFDALPG